MRVISDPSFVTVELRRYVKEIEDCERILMEKPRTLGKTGFLKENLRR